ncbi:P-selectin-like, partial [Saccostrea cucullata]|uniref:P-selectin-like n=1 Tax=Saccostrea cuccullata TaxID=36930 RepID=UPI002ED4FC67
SRCSQTIQEGHLINCRAHIGDTCQYECTSPFQINPSSPTITCNTNREWSHDTTDLCVQLCVSTIPNGTLGSDCQRVIGSNCSFTCDMGYESSITSSHIICTSNGTWNKMTDDLCKLQLCVSTIPNGTLGSDCQRVIGSNCSFTCDTGYESSITSSHITCTSNGTWNKMTDDLCKLQLCSSTILNGTLDSDCQRLIGSNCSFTCDTGYESSITSSNIICTSNGTWNKMTDDLCKLQLCVSTIPNGTLGSDCQRVIGSNCSFMCDTGYESSITSSHIICTSNGTWNKMTDALCKLLTQTLTLYLSPLEYNIMGITLPGVDPKNLPLEPQRSSWFFRLPNNMGRTPPEVLPAQKQYKMANSSIVVETLEKLVVQQCVSTIPNGTLGSECQRVIGSNCSFTCDTGYESSVTSSHIICTTNGTWSKTTDALCK